MANYTNTLGFSGIRPLMTAQAAHWIVSLGENRYKLATLRMSNGVIAQYEVSDETEQSSGIREHIAIFKRSADYTAYPQKPYRILYPESRFDASNPLHAALFSINIHYGRGSIDRIELQTEESGRYYVVTHFGGAFVYDFSVKSGRVFARGASRKIQG